MRILIFICLSFIASMQLTQAQPTLVGNQSPVDFSTLNLADSPVDFLIKPKEQALQEIINGETRLFISDIEWNDNAMADYQKLYGKNPKRVVLAAFNLKENAQAEKLKDLNPEVVSEIFSTRNGTHLLYLYMGESDASQDQQAIASFLIKDAQQWFEEQGLIAIPEYLYQQNLVTLGLSSPEFVGGYK